jgi:uncharacterized membrane protein
MMTFLAEFLTTKVFLILLAIVFLTLAAMLFSTREKNNAPVDKLGIVYALIAAVFYGISSYLSKCLTNAGTLFAQQIYKSLFVLLTAAAFVLLKDKSFKLNAPKTKKEFVLPLLGGVLFFGNSSFYLLAYCHMEGSIVMMLHQLNAVWLFLLGVFVFKEIDFKQHWLRLIIGLVLSVFGLLSLILAKV